MLIGEIVLRKRKIEKDIEDYNFYIDNIEYTKVKDSGTLYTKSLNSLFELYGKLQSHNALLDKENANNEVTFGESVLVVSDALHICKTIYKKIEVLTCIIQKNDYSISIDELINTRNKLTEEHIALRKVIEISDWSTDVE